MELRSFSTLMQLIQDLIEKINTKTLDKLHRIAVEGFEITLHNKIRVHYTNGNYENFGSLGDCIEMLSLRYNLPKRENKASSDQNGKEKNIFQEVGNTPLEIIINGVTNFLKSAQASKSTIYQNKEELLELLRLHRSHMREVKQSELLTAFALLYKNTFANDPDMFIYFEAINKEIAAVFSR